MEINGQFINEKFVIFVSKLYEDDTKGVTGYGFYLNLVNKGNNYFSFETENLAKMMRDSIIETIRHANDLD